MSKLTFKFQTENIGFHMDNIASFGNRIAYSPAECNAVNYIVEQMQVLGLEIKRDEMGGIYGIRRGTNPDKTAIVFGSHTDSVSNGGIYDGMAGVLSSLAMIRQLNFQSLKTESDIVVMALRAEEGGTTGIGCMNSKFIAGNIKEKNFSKYKIIEPTLAHFPNLAAAIDNAHQQLDSSIPFIKPNDFKWGDDVYELHIKQDDDMGDNKIGIVNAIWSPNRFKIRIHVPENSPHYKVHDGATSQKGRADALQRLCELRDLMNMLVSSHGDKLRVNMGKIEVPNQGMNKIPMDATGYFSVRSGDMKLRDEFVENFISAASRSAKYKVDVERLDHGTSVVVPRHLVETVERAAKKRRLRCVETFSGAGHDAAYLGGIVIFIPSTGASHARTEKCKIADISRGADVLFNIATSRAGISKAHTLSSPVPSLKQRQHQM